MTDIQLPLQHQNHQKGMNGKYSAKNLEIRGFSGNTNSTNQIVNVNETKNTNGSATKKSLKIIEKTTPSTNFQVLRFNPNNEFGTLVSVIDVNPNITKNRNSFNKNNKIDYNTNNATILNNNYSEIIQLNSHSFNANKHDINIKENIPVNATNPTASIRNPFWNDESNSGWTGTGVMSDRSSVYSIDDGDFDREASRKVNNQLREIESILYEQNSTHSSNQIECNEWLEKFPHIRILGKQIILRDDTTDNRSSMQSIPTLKTISSNFTNVTTSSTHLSLNNKLEVSSTTPSLNENISNEVNLESAPTFNNYKYFRRRENSDLNSQLLNVYGTSMSIRNVNDDLNSKSDEFSAFEEEIFEQEGVYEELLAYDNQEEEYFFEHNKRLNLNKRRRHGLPPITPKAAMKDLVSNFLFDHMWCEMIDWLADTIKAYARNISEDFIFSDDSSCKTPRLVSTPNPDLNESLDKIIENVNIKSNTNNSNVSPSYSSLMHNNTYATSETNNPPIVQNANNNININTNNNNNNNSNSLATNVTKANIIQLKLFDSQFNSNLYPIQSYTPSLLTRDNSNLYAAPNKNEIYSSNYNSNNDTLGDLMTKDLLQIKQLNRNGSSTGTNSVNKTLNPIVLSQSRVSSGNRRQLQINYYRKRYSSIEMGANLMPVDKNIIIHGAGLAKPSNHFNENSSTATTTPSSANSFLPFSNITTSAFTNTNNYPFTINNRSANNSSQAYNHQMNDENIYENDYNDFNLYENGENSIDEINVINQNNNNLTNTNIPASNNINKANTNNTHSNHGSYYNHSHLNYFGFHQHNNSHLNHGNFQPLPPIENSLTLKPIRISSANINNNSGLKQIKERNERPMTSTATRFDLNGIPTISKRSTTPSGLTSANKAAINKKTINVRPTPDDSIFINNFLSTKSFNFLMNNNTTTPGNNGSIAPSQPNNTNQNRRNSIKDSHSLTRIYR